MLTQYSSSRGESLTLGCFDPELATVNGVSYNTRAAYCALDPTIIPLNCDNMARTSAPATLTVEYFPRRSLEALYSLTKTASRLIIGDDLATIYEAEAPIKGLYVAATPEFSHIAFLADPNDPMSIVNIKNLTAGQALVGANGLFIAVEEKLRQMNPKPKPSVRRGRYHD